MRLIYIYGPPAAGKLTTARALSALTGYRVFHNHLSIDCVRPIFEFGSEPFWRQVHLIRQNVLEEAARQDVDLIYTSVFSHPKDLPLVQRRFGGVEQNGGVICPVQLVCAREALEERVTADDRVAANKLVSLDVLHDTLRKNDLYTPIPGRESLSIDNTQLPAQEVASLIAMHYELPTPAPESSPKP